MTTNGLTKEEEEEEEEKEDDQEDVNKRQENDTIEVGDDNHQQHDKNKDGDDNNDHDDVEDEDDEGVSLSQYVHKTTMGLWKDPSVAASLKPFVRQLDAYLELSGPSSCQLPALDWKLFRKSYSVLVWICPVLRPNKDDNHNDNDGDDDGDSHNQQQRHRRKWLLRLCTSEQDASGTGVTIQFTQDWVLHSLDNSAASSSSSSSSSVLDAASGRQHKITTNLTTYALPPSPHSSLTQVPITLTLHQWNLVGITHTFPYLKRPQLTVCVNGSVQGGTSVELPYPVVDTPSNKTTPIMPHNSILHNVGLMRVLIPARPRPQEQEPPPSDAADDSAKTATALTAPPSYTHEPLSMRFASCAVHAEPIPPELQALLYTTGPALSLQQLGKVVSPLPPVDNWTKGSSWDGPNVGIPLAVHPQFSLALQHLSGKVVHAFGATHAKVLRGRIILPQPYTPGVTDSTPKVGLVQPSIPKGDKEVPTLHVFGDGVHVVHALSEYLLQCDNGTVDTQLFHYTKHLSIVLLEQGLLPGIVLPFFLSLLPAGHGLSLQKNLYQQSLRYLYNLYSRDGQWASELIGLLCDTIQYGGGRAHELVLQSGLIHVLGSTLRQSLVRAHSCQVHKYRSLEEFLQSAPKEQTWFRPTHEQASPSWIPPGIVQAGARLVAVACGLAVEVLEFSPAVKLLRSSDLALTTLFGWALNLDLWGPQHCEPILQQVAWRYGNVQGGQILRKQIPIQSILDLVRVRSSTAAAAASNTALYLAQVVQHMLLASLTHPKNISMAEHDVSACLCALSDCSLGSIGAHIVLSSLVNILEWCHSATSTDEQVLGNIASRLGRNLVMGQFHDVLAPMLLSRTIFCGNNSTNPQHTTTNLVTMQTDTTTTASTTTTTTSWQAHWRMALTLFAWVTSTSGPEGSVAAQSTGSLLLASGLAGSLNGVLVDESKADEEGGEQANQRFIANLFLPPPTMSLMLQKEHVNSWNYADILSDRLQVMVPLLPGLVVSLVWDVKPKRLEMLQEMVSAVGGAFHRVFGVLMQNTTTPSTPMHTPRKGGFLRPNNNNNKTQNAAVIQAAQDYVPHLVLVVVWLEHAIQSRSAKNPTDAVSTVVLQAAPPKTPEDRQRSDSQGSWVEVSSNAFADTDTIALESMILKQTVKSDETETVQLLGQSQKAILSTLTELLSNAMKLGGGEASTVVWKRVLQALQDAVMYCDAKNQAVKNMAHDILCRLVAIVLTKAQSREYEWEMWTVELCSAVARLVDMIEEKELLLQPRGAGRTYTRDQIVLLHSLLQVMKYGRDMTGWCQLVLPSPPDAPLPMQQQQQPKSMGELSIEEHVSDIIEKADNLYQQVAGASSSSVDMSSSINMDTLDGGRHYFVPPEAPGVSSKLLLPVLQPCLRVVLAGLGQIREPTQITVPKHQPPRLPPNGGPPIQDVVLQDPIGLLQFTTEELKQTMIAAIVGLSFPNARDVSLDGMAWLRRLLLASESADSPLCELLGHVVEEIRVRYEGERRRREKALFDAYDDGEEAVASAEVERMILGGDLIPSQAPLSIPSLREQRQETMEEITFATSDIEADEIIKPQEPEHQPQQQNSGTEDFVMFHEDYNDDKAEGGAKLGWDHYKGLGSTLEECGRLLKQEEGDDSPPLSKSKQAEMLLKLLAPYLDTWDARVAQEVADSEIVQLFGDAALSEGSSAADGVATDHAVVKASQTAADAMSTFIEMASVEKSRLAEVMGTFLPSCRYSVQAYAGRYCWAKYFEAVDDNDECGMTKLWERGVGDGNRDIRSRLISMPCNPQFKRYIPRHLDLGADIDEEVHQTEQDEPDKKKKDDEPEGAATSEEEYMETIKSVVEAGKLEIVDITKKEIQEEEMPELLTTPPVGEDFTETDDDIYGDGSLGFPSRPGESSDDDSAKQSVDDTASTGAESSDDGAASSVVTQDNAHFVDKSHGGRHHHIASCIFSHPPDNSSSIVSLMLSSAASLVEKHFDHCLHVKAEGSRKCTLLLTSTHLIIEYDAESEGLFEGEMMAVREEAERQRLIEEAGGASADADGDHDKIQEELERRQKEMAALRPRSIRWNLSELSHVYLRRYRLRDSALEMFFIPSGGTSYGGYGLYSPATSVFVDFGSGHDGNRRRDDAAHAIMRRSPPQTIKQWPDKSGQFLHEQLSRLTMGWVEGRITNFDYLLHLNMLAGRSYNDLCQYPVMPWVLSDYTSEEIPDLTDRSKFRDLSKPMGAINQNRLNDFLERFNTFADPSIPPFMYGSHYSTSAGVVLHFLVRLHPFAGLHRQLQGGHFDVADRLFSSIPRTWDMCTGYSAAEVKELTPEWYCNPSFLKNTNNFKLGTSQDGELLGDVILPPWAEKSPERFVEVMRNALESDICSEMLPDWIDLIFGRKQQGPEAIKANNVFFYLTYYGSVDVASIEDEALRQATELQIAHFGQCPMQLFVRPHVRRAQTSINYRRLTFYQLLSAYSQGADHRGEDGIQREVDRLRDGTQRLFGEPFFLPFFSAPLSHWIHLDAPPPGPHAPLIAARLAGVDRCLAVDGNGIFHSFRWAWKPDPPNESDEDLNQGVTDRGNFIAQRELPRFRTVPRLVHAPSKRDDTFPPVAISKTLFASRSVLLVLSDGDGRGGLAMQLVDPAKGSVKGEAVVPGVHSARVTCVVMDPIGTAAGHGGVGGELAIIGSEDGGASLWRFMSSHYLPLRPRMRMRGHAGRKIQAVALSSAIHICATVSSERCCIFSIGNGCMIRSFPPPQGTLNLPNSRNTKSKTVFCDTPAMCLSVQGFIVTVCKTTLFSDDDVAVRDVITLHLFSLEGVFLGSKALESWRGIPRKISCTPDGTAITVCSGRGVTIHRLSAITPLEFVDEWHVTETDELNEHVPAAYDVDFGPSLMRPIVAAAACSGGVLRLHALPGISPWSERHKKSTMNIGSALSKPVGRLRSSVAKGLGFGKSFVGVGKEITKEVSSDVKERGVGGFLAGTLFRKKAG